MTEPSHGAQGVRRLHVRLHLADGVGPIRFRRMIDHFGSVEQACAASAAELRDVEGVGEKTAAAIRAVDEAAVEQEFALAEKHGVRILCHADDEYPIALRNIDDPPPVLYVLGRLQREDVTAVAVVGSRRCTVYGLEQAERFGGLLGRAGFTIVSGGARGIDTAAHRGALAAGGRTIAVMGCGLCLTYPRENRELFEQIVGEDRGAIVSALPMGVGVDAKNFPARNRIISGLSQGVLVVEAAYRSGSLITARLALEQGRTVFAVPGRVDSAFSQGTNQLIHDGAAALVQNLDDVLAELGDLGRTLAAEPTAQPAPPPAPGVDGTEAAILAAFDGQPMSVDQLSSATGLPAHRVVSAMTMLALKGLVAQQPGGVFARRMK